MRRTQVGEECFEENDASVFSGKFMYVVSDLTDSIHPTDTSSQAYSAVLRTID